MRGIDRPETGVGVLKDVLRLHVGGVRGLPVLAQPPARPPRFLLDPGLGGGGAVGEDSGLQHRRPPAGCIGELEGLRPLGVWLCWGDLQRDFRQVG